MPARRIVLALEGEIGAGKTTLLRLLREALVVRGRTIATVPEPVGEWERVGILKAFYETPSAHNTYAFNAYVTATRVAETLRQLAAVPDADVVLLERSIYTDRHVFMHGLHRDHLPHHLYAMYTVQWDELWHRVLAELAPTHVVYLKPTLSTCMVRVNKRARGGETTAVSLDYQHRLRQAHEAFFQSDRAPAVPLVLEGAVAEEDFASCPDAAQRVVMDVLKHLGLDA